MRSATEHRSDSEAPESPTAGGYETLLPYQLTAAAAGGRALKKGTKDNLNIVLLKSERCFPARIALDI